MKQWNKPQVFYGFVICHSCSCEKQKLWTLGSWCRCCDLWSQAPPKADANPNQGFKYQVFLSQTVSLSFSLMEIWKGRRLMQTPTLIEMSVCHKMGVSSIPKGSSLCFHVNGHFLVSNAKLSEASFVSSEALKCWRLASWCHPTWGSISRKMSNPLVNYHNYGKSPFFMGKFTISMVIFHSYVMLVCQRVSEFEPYPHHSAS